MSDDDTQVKNCHAIWLPAPVKAQEDFTKQYSQIRKDILNQISSLKASHVIFDLDYSASVSLFLGNLSQTFLEEGKQQLTILIDEFLPLFKAKPYELNHLEGYIVFPLHLSLLDEREFTLSEVISELLIADILPRNILLDPIRKKAESLSTLDFFQTPINENRLTIRAWTTSSTILNYLKGLVNYTHPSYEFPLGASLPQRLIQWSKLCREHYLDLSGFESRVNTLLISDSSDPRVFNEILRMKSYRVECCRRLCVVWEQLGSDLSDKVDEMAIIAAANISSSDSSLEEFFKSTHMDSGVRILRLGLAELASQISRGAIPGLILTSTGYLNFLTF